MLNEFVYCPRLFHLMHVEGRWADNQYTVEGQAAHRRVDAIDHVLEGPAPPTDSSGVAEDSAAQPTGDEPPTIARSVQLASDVLGIVGKLDLVSTSGDEAVPVETKRGFVPDNAERSWEPERVQLMAQGLLLREHGYRCDHGFLYYRKSRTKVEIPFTEQLERRTRECIAAARAAASATVLPPPLDDSPKCNGCSLSGICLPDETHTMRGDAAPGSEPRRLYAPRDETSPFYVQEQGAQVGKRGESLVVRAKGEEIGTARLHDVSHLVLLGNVGVTAQTIALLTDAQIPIVHMSRGHWFHGITYGMGLRNAYDRAAQFAAAANPERRLQFARAVVHAKIRNQRTLLRRNGGGVDSKVLAVLAASADEALRAVELPVLLGLEGTGAAAYFGEFQRMLRGSAIAPAFDFTTRNRRPPKDPVNAMLSFAYAMLTKELSVAILEEGLDPWWGLYHVPRHGRPSLALDLMEEFRPLIADSAVITAVNTRMVATTDFVCGASGCMMQPAARKALIRAFEGRLEQLASHPQFDYRVSWRAILRVQVRLFARWLRGDVPEYTGIMTR
jgi:CRISPR-associated protein Cas1